MTSHTFGALRYAGILLLSAALTTHAVSDEEPVADATYVAYDLETTGFSADNDRIVEMGAVKFKHGEVIEKKRWLINPGRPIPERAQMVHGISDAMVAKAPSFVDVYPKISEFLKGTTLIAHNATFDIRFLRAEMQRSGFDVPDLCVIDTLRLARKYYPEAESHKLGAMTKLLELPQDTFHRGLEDSVHAMGVYLKITELVPKDATLAVFRDAMRPLQEPPAEE